MSDSMTMPVKLLLERSGGKWSWEISGHTFAIYSTETYKNQFKAKQGAHYFIEQFSRLKLDVTKTEVNQ